MFLLLVVAVVISWENCPLNFHFIFWHFSVCLLCEFLDITFLLTNHVSIYLFCQISVSKRIKIRNKQKKITSFRQRKGHCHMSIRQKKITKNNEWISWSLLLLLFFISFLGPNIFWWMSVVVVVVVSWFLWVFEKLNVGDSLPCLLLHHHHFFFGYHRLGPWLSNCSIFLIHSFIFLSLVSHIISIWVDPKKKNF